MSSEVEPCMIYSFLLNLRVDYSSSYCFQSYYLRNEDANKEEVILVTWRRESLGCGRYKYPNGGI